MKPSRLSPYSSFPARCRENQGYTLVEVIFASAIFTLIMGSIISLNLFAARASQGLSRQLEMSSNTRVLNRLLMEIKSAQSVSIRNYDGSRFLIIPPGTPQRGNALILTLYDTSNSPRQVVYWLSNNNLYRATVNASDERLWLGNVTNSQPFSAQDYLGNTLSNLIDRVVINVDMGMIVDANTKDFRQTVFIRTAGTKRN